MDNSKDQQAKASAGTKCEGSMQSVCPPKNASEAVKNVSESDINTRIHSDNEYITKNLARSIFSRLRNCARKGYATEFEEYGSCLWVWGCDSVQIEDAIKIALDKIESLNPDRQWTLITLDTDHINTINDRIETIGRQNLVKIEEAGISTFLELPFISSSPLQQFGEDSDTLNEIIEKEGLGILYIKNLNETNYKNLPHNFIYSLNKNHSFCKVRLNPRWTVVVEVGPNVVLDTPGGVSAAFDARWYKDKDTTTSMNTKA